MTEKNGKKPASKEKGGYDSTQRSEEGTWTGARKKWATAIKHSVGRIHEGLQRRGWLPSELMYRDFFQNLPIGLYRSTVDGRFVGVNQTLADMLGWDRAEALVGARSDQFYWDVDDRRRWKELLLQRGIIREHEVRLRRRDGSILWVRETCRVVFGVSGQPMVFEGSVEDITEQKRAEQALDQIDERYRALIERQGEGLALVGPDEKVLLCNRITAEMFGVSVNELQGRCLDDFVEKEDFDRLKQETEKRRHGERSTYRITVCRPNGEVRRLQVTATPWMDESGEFSGAFGIVRDVTEEEAAERALKLSEEKYRAVVTQSADGIFLVDLESHQILEANQTWRRMLGYDSDDLSDLSLDDFVVVDSDADQDELDLAVRAHSSFVGERRYRRRDGSFLDVDVSTSLVEYGEKQVACVMARDISQRKQAAEALKKTQQHLQRLHTIEVVGRLAGGVAHDFNNVMTGILGYCELLLRPGRIEDSGVRKAIGGIQEDAERAAKLTRQLLAFSRRQAMTTSELDLDDVVDGLMGLMTRLVGDQVQVQVDVEEPGLSVSADRGQIEQVILNLVLNARDAMPGGGSVRIVVGRRDVDDDHADRVIQARVGEFAVLVVEDSGEGIDPENVKHIFEPFYTTKEAGKGTGLGLSTVYGIVEQHRGWVEVDSRIGVGSRFIVYLPFSEGESFVREDSGERVVRTLHMPLVDNDEVEDLTVERKWVLVADADEDARQRSVGWLREKGYAVVGAGSSQDAMSAFETLQDDVDVVVASTDLSDYRSFVEGVLSRNPEAKVLLGGLDSEAASELPAGILRLPSPLLKQALIEGVEAAVESLNAG
ncbi:MAG: PAS domain S-box protein [Deltaproteobacteria bacterium]|nr:PAS domain S-box protein [Deltaproteobacteria bacterium]